MSKENHARGAAETEALVRACGQGDLEAARSLLEAGADPNAPLRLSLPAAGRLAGFLRGESGLGFLAALDLGKGPRDEAPLSPLCAAAERGDPEMISLLLSRGADHGAKGERGETPLIVAAALGKSAACAALLEAGADPEAKERNGYAALHLAAAGGHLEAILSLAKSGASLEARTDRGETALHVAAAFGQAEACALLSDLGADLSALAQRGMSPYQVALASGARAAASALEGRMILEALAREVAARPARNSAPRGL